VQPGDSDATTAGATRIVLRPVASSYALGFLGLAGASMTLAAMQLGWIPIAQQHQVALIVLVAGSLPQLVGSVFGFLARDAIAAGGLGWLSATWLAYALVLLSERAGELTALPDHRQRPSS
jgi:succinate-acetate transporter protein